MAKTKDALKILDRRIGRNRTMRRLIEAERVNADIAQMIYDARTQAGLTQEELAKRVGTKQPVIARLEDADYEGPTPSKRSPESDTARYIAFPTLWSTWS